MAKSRKNTAPEASPAPTEAPAEPTLYSLSNDKQVIYWEGVKTGIEMLHNEGRKKGHYQALIECRQAAEGALKALEEIAATLAEKPVELTPGGFSPGGMIDPEAEPIVVQE